MLFNFLNKRNLTNIKITGLCTGFLYIFNNSIFNLVSRSWSPSQKWHSATNKYANPQHFVSSSWSKCS